MFYLITASSVTYSIVEGNTDNAFLIEAKTGKIRVNGQLDYENITNVSFEQFYYNSNFMTFKNVCICRNVTLTCKS